MKSGIFIEGKPYPTYEDWKQNNPEEYNKIEKIYFSFDDWKNGDLPWSSWHFRYGEIFCFYKNEDVSKIHVLPESEYQKIVAKQEEILESQIRYRLDWLLENFEKRLAKSLEPELLIQQSLEGVIQLLTNKDFNEFPIFLLDARSTLTHLKNQVAEWYDKINVKVIYEARMVIHPSDENDFSRGIPQVEAIVLHRFREYLKGLLNKKIILEKQEQAHERNAEIKIYNIDKVDNANFS